MLERDLTTCSEFVNHSRLNIIVNILGGDICGLLMAHCNWTLIIQNNSRLAPKLNVVQIECNIKCNLHYDFEENF